MRDIRIGDCLSIMPTLPENSIDSIITDPPYGLEFMGKEWDKLDGIGRDRSKAIQKSSFGKIMNAGYETPRIVRSQRRKCKVCGGYSGGPFQRCSCDNPQWIPSTYPMAMQEWHYRWAVQALRVAKPGAILMAFGGTRTFHRLACAIEDAGWEIRDTMCWLYGSGFPKSLDISKAIDREAGLLPPENVGFTVAGAYGKLLTTAPSRGYVPPEPKTEGAKLWQGHGTALKPAWEPIIVAMKPLEGTYAENAQKWGVAGLNIDGGRIGTEPTLRTNGKTAIWSDGGMNSEQGGSTSGRWPANLLLDEESARLLDEQSGELTSGNLNAGHRQGSGMFMDNEGKHILRDYGGDHGGASRFFYTSKASSSERNAGLEDCEPQFAPTMGNGIGGKEHDPETATKKLNIHPTVKPVDLMRYLCKLTRTPTGGVVLDPFMGSGTTGIACILEHRDFIGIEIDSKYAEIAKKRIADMEGPLFQEAA
jgi:DNA modification methylase